MSNASDKLNEWVVLYRDDSLLPCDAPLVFLCMAEDADHAEEQCEGAYPGCDVVWVVPYTGNVDAAYENYWGLEEMK